MIGAAIILAIMFLIGPVALFLGGALWSALFGYAVGETVQPDLDPAPS